MISRAILRRSHGCRNRRRRRSKPSPRPRRSCRRRRRPSSRYHRALDAQSPAAAKRKEEARKHASQSAFVVRAAGNNGDGWFYAVTEPPFANDRRAGASQAHAICRLWLALALELKLDGRSNRAVQAARDTLREHDLASTRLPLEARRS